LHRAVVRLDAYEHRPVPVYVKYIHMLSDQKSSILIHDVHIAIANAGIRRQVLCEYDREFAGHQWRHAIEVTDAGKAGKTRHFFIVHEKALVLEFIYFKSFGARLSELRNEGRSLGPKIGFIGGHQCTFESDIPVLEKDAAKVHVLAVGIHPVMLDAGLPRWHFQKIITAAFHENAEHGPEIFPVDPMQSGCVKIGHVFILSECSF
jgi:hypothetical protein